MPLGWALLQIVDRTYSGNDRQASLFVVEKMVLVCCARAQVKKMSGRCLYLIGKAHDYKTYVSQAYRRTN